MRAPTGLGLSGFGVGEHVPLHREELGKPPAAQGVQNLPVWPKLVCLDARHSPAAFLDQADDVVAREPAQMRAIAVPVRLVAEGPTEVQVAQQRYVPCVRLG